MFIIGPLDYQCLFTECLSVIIQSLNFVDGYQQLGLITLSEAFYTELEPPLLIWNQLARLYPLTEKSC